MPANSSRPSFASTSTASVRMLTDRPKRFSKPTASARTGAILIRPDGFVAWRATSQEASPVEELADALGHVLARPVQSPFAGPRELKALPVAPSAEDPGQQVNTWSVEMTSGKLGYWEPSI